VCSSGFSHFLSATEPYCGVSGSLEMVTSITFLTDGNDKSLGPSPLHIHFSMQQHILLHALCLYVLKQAAKDSKQKKSIKCDVWMCEWRDLKGSVK